MWPISDPHDRFYIFKCIIKRGIKIKLQLKIHNLQIDCIMSCSCAVRISLFFWHNRLRCQSSFRMFWSMFWLLCLPYTIISGVWRCIYKILEAQNFCSYIASLEFVEKRFHSSELHITCIKFYDNWREKHLWISNAPWILRKLYLVLYVTFSSFS